MPSGDLSYRLFLTQGFSDNLIALLGAPPTRFGHLSLLAGCPAYLWPFYSHLSRVPNLLGHDIASLLDSLLRWFGLLPQKRESRQVE